MAIIGSIFMLSMKDTLDVVHTILHKIPNPFHHHHIEDHSFYHHRTDPHRGFFSAIPIEKNKHTHTHSLEDHIPHSHTKDVKAATKKDKSSKSKVAKKIKIDLFTEVYTSMVKSMSDEEEILFSYLPVFFYHTTQFPPNPPPEISAS